MKNLDLDKLQELIKDFINASATFSITNYTNEVDKENDIIKYQKLSDEIIQIVRFVTNTTINKVRE